MKLITRNIKGRWREMILGPLFKLFEAVLELLVPLVMADIIDKGVANGDASYVVRGGLLMLGLALLGTSAGIVCQYFAAVAAGHFGRRLRAQVYGHVMALSAAEADGMGAAALITRVTNDTVQLQQGVNMFIRLATRVPYLAFGSIVMAMLINWRVGLVFLAATPLIALVLFLIMRRTLPSYGSIQRQQDKLSRLTAENLDGARVIRAFSREEAEQQTFDEAGRDMTRLLVRVGRLSALLNPVTSVVANLAVAAIIWMGARYVFAGSMQPGEIIALVNYMNTVLLSLFVAANLIVVFTRALASGKRLSALLAVQPSVVDGPGAQEDPEAPALLLEDVCFAYHEGAEDALSGVGFTVGRGKTLGVIGGTGSGKSTLARLILRFYDAREGGVLVFGPAAKDYTLAQLRQKIGFVPQGAALFEGTVRSNLRMSAPHADEQEMWQALETAQAAKFVRALPEGLDARIEEGGGNLSGGQRQRLTIARALVRGPELLILDDATSALDYATEAALRKALAAYSRRRAERGDPMTVMMISQRVSAVKNADLILVLDDGRLAGAATHEQLLETNEVYREIYSSQAI